jgi:GNAT superfamily N-acetyltransferase
VTPCSAVTSIDYTVRPVPVERILALRKAVLRPYLPEDDPFVLADDHLPTTVVFGAVTPDDRVIGIGRLTPEPPPFATERNQSWRLRGMATSPESRNMGVGSAVLRALIGYVADSGGGILWCNARVGALGLYERGGMQRWGDVWEEPHIGPHVVMWRNIL